MKKVKITILKTMLNEDLAKEYGICGLKACPMMKVGDVFYADYAKPEGFCDEAWKAIYQYVFALAHGEKKGCSTMVTGSRNLVLPLSVAMTVCAL
jgi:uncharacterized repeat protein (TIGR04076 family)